MKLKESVPRFIKLTAILVVFSMLSITWSSTVLTVKADGEKQIGFVEYFEIEITHKSDPLVNDTDGDGLDDKEELTYGQDGHITDPCDRDTDGDGMRG